MLRRRGLLEARKDRKRNYHRNCRLSQPKSKQPEPIVIPPLPDIVCGVKIDRLKQQAYQEGKFISIGICDPGGVVPINHWVWFDFDKREPVMSRTYPSRPHHRASAFAERNSGSLPAATGSKAIPRIVIAECRNPPIIAFSRWKHS